MRDELNPKRDVVSEDTLPTASDEIRNWPNEVSHPDRLGRFVVERILGSGTFATVYLARDDQGDLAAVKVLRREFAANEAMCEQFAQEATILRALHHEGIVEYKDYFVADNGLLCLVTEYLSGGSLADQIGKTEWTPIQIVEIIAQLATALHQMHLSGYTHRDVKPANILFDNARHPKLVDVGLALDDRLYGCGQQHVTGSLAYVSPEQARGDSNLVDGRADVYGLGVVMYEMLSGRRPFSADDSAELLRRIRTIAIKPPRQINASIPAELEAICLQATAREPEHRYATAADFAQALTRYVDSVRFRRNTAFAQRFAIAAFVVCLMFIGGIAALWSNKPVRQDSDPGTGYPLVKAFDVLCSREGGVFTPIDELEQLRLGDAIRFSVTLAEPAYVRLLWINRSQGVREYYPHDPEVGDRGNQPTQEFTSPARLDKAWRLEGVEGDEIALLLVNREPISKSVVANLQWGTTEVSQSDRTARYLASRSDGPTVVDRATRSLSSQSVHVDDPLLRMLETLRPEADAVYAIRMPAVAD